MSETENTSEHLRRLEGWLPLAQALNEELDWKATPTVLESLIALASPALDGVGSLAEARAILAWYHRLSEEHP